KGSGSFRFPSFAGGESEAQSIQSLNFEWKHRQGIHTLPLDTISFPQYACCKPRHCRDKTSSRTATPLPQCAESADKLPFSSPYPLRAARNRSVGRLRHWHTFLYSRRKGGTSWSGRRDSEYPDRCYRQSSAGNTS